MDMRHCFFFYIFLIFLTLGDIHSSLPQIDDQQLVVLAERYGTPLYVYGEDRIRENYRKLHEAFKRRFADSEIYYAVKANSHPAILQILRDEGAGFDCSCLEEVRLVKQIGVPSDKIICTGAYVPENVMREILALGIQVNFDCLSILEALNEETIPECVSFRINPGIGMSGCEGLIFAGEDAKFGISPLLAENAYAKAKQLGAKRFGAHMMTGSNILDPNYFPAIVESLLDIIGPIAQKLEITFDYLDLGGSFGIPYHPDETPLDIDRIAEQVIAVVERKLKEYGMGRPKIIMEPGRFIVGDAGVLLTQVTSIKDDVQKFVGVDAGINTLYFLEGAYRHILPLARRNTGNNTPANVVGSLCTNKDIFARDFPLPSDIQEGDYLCIQDVGAYGYVKSSQFNTRPRCAEVLISDGDSYLIRQAETLDDLFIKTSVPYHLLPLE